MNETKFVLHDEGVEISVLGSLVWSCKEGNFDAFFESRLTKDLFYSPQNATIFEVVSDLIMSRVIPDAITIMDKVRTDGIKGIDPSDVIVRTEWVPGQEVNFYEHVRILRDFALRRKAQSMAQLLANGSSDPTVRIEEVVAEIDKLKADAAAMAFSTFSPFYKGAGKDRIKELLLKRGENLSTGYRFGSEELMIPPKALTFIVAATGHCKTTYLINLALRVCKAYPEKKCCLLATKKLWRAYT